MILDELTRGSLVLGAAHEFHTKNNYDNKNRVYVFFPIKESFINIQENYIELIQLS
jgi:hypothetical protein